MYSLSDYQYDLPGHLIAQHPAATRDLSRLLCLDRQNGDLRHHTFADLPDLLSPGDVLVINDTRVVPARLIGKKQTGGKVDMLLIDYAEKQDAPGQTEPVFKCMIKSSKRCAVGSVITFDHGLRATILGAGNGNYTARFSSPIDFDDQLDLSGRMPLPPYIRDENRDEDRDQMRYQTVYASKKGAIAAPTAGLHFTEDLLKTIESGGIHIARITLHVGHGTFLPVRVSDIRKHRMHSEWYEVPSNTSQLINQARSKGHRVVAVGTTSVRTLEYSSGDDGRVLSGTGLCDLFIYQGYRFKVVDALITNFHLPGSTLLMLVSALAGRSQILDAYRVAVENQYRFYSYGDAMFIY